MEGEKETHGRSSVRPTVGRCDDLQWVFTTTYHRVRLRVGVEGTKGRNGGGAKSGDLRCWNSYCGRLP